MSDALDALRRVDFDWVRTLDSVWLDLEPTGGPNDALPARIVADLHEEAPGRTARAMGRVLVGPSGVGKTHLVGQLRREAWRSGGWFVMLDVLGLTEFWRSAALSFLTALLHQMPDGRRQSDAVLAGVARQFKVESQVEEAFNTPDVDARRIVALLVKALMSVDMGSALKHQDVFRALCLLRSNDFGAVGLAHAWLQGYDADPVARAELGFLRPPPTPKELVEGMSWIMSLSGPVLVAVDQIDGVIDASHLGGGDEFAGRQGLAEVLAAGLLELHDVRHRGMTVIACLEESWERLQERALKPLLQRYVTPVVLRGMNDRTAAGALIRARLAPAYAEAGFEPPHPTWPFSDAAIAAAAGAGMMPRTLLMRCDAFRRDCLARGAVAVCESLNQAPDGPPHGVTADAGFDLDAAKRGADIAGLLDEEATLGEVLRTAFDLYALEDDPDDALDVASKGEPDQRIPPLHGRLTLIDRDRNDHERHVCYRALLQQNAIAFQARLRAALTASGISARMPDRDLVIVRRGPVPGGAKTKQLFDAFLAAAGVLIDPADDDLRTFVALRDLRAGAVEVGRQDRFEAWLRAHRFVRATAFFRQAGLAEAGGAVGQRVATGKGATEAVNAPVTSAVPVVSEQLTAAISTAPPGAVEVATTVPVDPTDAVPVGHRLSSEAPVVTLPLRLLPRHTSIIAGSGSGKTVLLRRLVEEAALAGIPAIVIDPNNDLSRLGTPWPERPTAFTAEDADKAARYAERVEVVVWTPGVYAGNPLFLSVLPDFSGLGDDRDERGQAVEMAAETLGPLAGAKKTIQKGVLADALRLATNPLLKAKGAVLDPQILFFGSDPARTRISVINLSGLASEAAREDFVNRLQMTLFGWIKKHPSPRGMLYVVDEAQTFLPSQRACPSLGSGIKLVAQGRKYGLGMVVATQVPRGLHNQIVSNCTTQFFGRQSAPATIAAAQEIMAASGGAAGDIGKLGAGEFYFATEGSGKPAKLRTPLCLSHHPANPLIPEQVVALGKRSAAGT